MNRSGWRLLLTCLLLVALPLKGFAAASMLACGPDHDSMIGDAMTHIGEPASSTTYEHGDAILHQHPVTLPGAPGPDLSNGLSYDAASPSQDPHFNAKAKCGACTPCCAGAALTSDGLFHIAILVSGTDFPVFAAVHRSAPVTRLDRPPRFILA